MSLTPIPSDQFTFGLWTVGYNGTDPFVSPGTDTEHFISVEVGAGVGRVGEKSA